MTFIIKLKRKKLTQSKLKELLEYNPLTGVLIWRVSLSRHKAGTIAGSRLSNNGYLNISVDRKSYLAHRLIWLYMTGNWPKNQIDHIDMDKFNNKWNNLREATISQNQHNRKKYSNNSTGFKGVDRRKDTGLYRARIQLKGKSMMLGYFKTAKEAHIAYQKATVLYHKDFARAA